MRKPNILVITPVRHIAGVSDTLERTGRVTYLDDPTPGEVREVISEYDAIYTNPNKSKVYIGRELMDAGERLRAICTASTGTNHIDMAYAAERNLPVLALTEEREVIERISSTAEMAFTLTLAALRNLVRAHEAVLRGEWDYTKYIGRQMNCLTVGVIGHGRLGSMYAGYAAAMGARVLVYDPYKTVRRERIEQTADLETLLRHSDVVALHVHVTPETTGLINAERLRLVKDNVLLVNTSRGEIVDEAAIVEFLRTHPRAKVATDVLADEVRNREASPLLRHARESDQVTISPHVGGMTREAQEIAYGHAAVRLERFFELERF